MAKTNTFTGSTGSSYWTWKIIVTEGTGSVSTMKVPVTIALYLGRTSSAGGSYFYGSCTLNYSCGNQSYSSSWSASSQISVSAGSWYKMGEYTFQVDSGATVSVGGSMSSATFSPYNGSASGNITVETLHTAPEITAVTLTEKNSTLTSLSVPNNTIVNILSTKSVAITTTLYDSATVSKYVIYDANGNQVGTNTTSPVTATFSNSVDSGSLSISVTDSLSSTGTYTNTYTFIPYFKTNLENTSTNIKRKTSSTVELIDNIAVLSLKGSIYKSTDVVGTKNSATCKYKIWKENTTEPSYTTSKAQSLDTDGTLIYQTNAATLTTASDGTISISDLEITLVNYLNVYNYKIYVVDAFGYSYEVSGTVPTGQAVWTEFKDRVDFLSATIGGNAIIASGDGYVKFYNGLMVCWGTHSNSASTWTKDSTIYYLRNQSFGNFAQTFISKPTRLISCDSTSATTRHIVISGNNDFTTTSAGTYNLANYWQDNSLIVRANYIAIGRWK